MITPRSIVRAFFFMLGMLLMSTTASSAAPQDQAVAIQNGAFSPQTVTVAPGTTVVWTNFDGTTHNASSNPSGSWTTGNLGLNESGQHSFASEGTFSYRCSIHPNMTGTVIVAAPPEPGDEFTYLPFVRH